MTAQDWVLIIGAVGGFVTLATGQAILLIKVLQAGKRREEIAEAIIDPNVTELPPKG